MATEKMRLQVRGLLLGLVGLVASLTVAADDGDASSEAFKWYSDTVSCYRDCEGFQAAFTHEAISAFDKRSAPFKGTISVSKHGLFKMIYQSPVSRQVVFNGKKIRGWDSSTQVAVEDSGNENALFAALISLFGAPLSELQSQFDIRMLAQNGADSGRKRYTVVEFVPKMATALVQKIVVTLGACPSVRRVIVVDRAGNMIRLTFRNVKKVESFPPKAFHLRLPPGTQVVRP